MHCIALRPQRRIEPWPQVTCKENLVKFGRVRFEICEQTFRILNCSIQSAAALTWAALQPSGNHEAGAKCSDSLTLNPHPTFAVKDCGNMTTNSPALCITRDTVTPAWTSLSGDTCITQQCNIQLERSSYSNNSYNQEI